MATKTVTGTLIPSNNEASACAFVRVRLYWSFTENGLREIVTKESKWDETGISFNSVTSALGSGQDIEKLTTSLEKVMETEDAVRLGFNGGLNVVIDADETSRTFNIIVENGAVHYKEVI